MEFKHNTFKFADAFEYVEAYKWAVEKPPEQVRERLSRLNARIERSLANIPSYMLAAYRGYEHALMFLENKAFPEIVKIDDRGPS